MTTCLASTRQDQAALAPKAPEHQAIPCFRCGVCCVKWQPLLSRLELKRLASELGVHPQTFKRRYTRPYPLRRGWHQFKTSDLGCVFLAYEQGRAFCTIHAVRPQVCRDWMPSLEQRECREGLQALDGPPLITLEHLYPATEERQRFVDVVSGGITEAGGDEPVILA